MTPRDRVLAALNKSEVYPVAVDVFENGMWPQLEASLSQHFGLAADDHERLLDALGSCVRWAMPRYIGPPLETYPGAAEPVYPARRIYRNIWGTWEGLETYSEVLYRPLRYAQSVSDVHAHKWPDPDRFDYQRVGWFWHTPETAEPVAVWSARHSEYGRLIGVWNPVFSRVMDLFGMEAGLVNLAARPDLIDATVGHIGDYLIEHNRRMARAARGLFDIHAHGDDFGGQNGMLLSPDMWRKYFLPLWRKIFDISHQNGLKAQLHSCGSIRPVIPDLIDAGLDILEVVQITAQDMDPVELKREFGRDLTFYGAFDTLHILPYGSPVEVRREARRLIDIFSKDGGYILSTTHFMFDEVPPENVLALYDEAGSYRPGSATE
jgi:uroporphyrinogen decarboxylase